MTRLKAEQKCDNWKGEVATREQKARSIAVFGAAKKFRKVGHDSLSNCETKRNIFQMWTSEEADRRTVGLNCAGAIAMSLCSIR